MWTSAKGLTDYEPSVPLLPVHLDLACTFKILEERVAGSCTVTARAVKKDRYLNLHAVNFLKVDVKGLDDREMTWSYNGTELSILWDDDWEIGTTSKVLITYEVQSPPKALNFSYPDELYPTRAISVVSDHETERARYWIPCVDNPMVRTTVDFHITAKAGLTALAGGSHRGTEKCTVDGEEFETHHWCLDIRTPSYLLCVAIGEFGSLNMETFGDTDLAVFTTAANLPESTLEPTFGRTRSIMQWLTDKLQVSFPLPKYYQVAVYGLHGAMENMTLVSWDDSWLVTEDTRKECGFRGDRIVMHEMAHTFFGNLVVVRHFAHAWLKEGWAHYMECVYLEDHYGKAAFEAELVESAAMYVKECSEYVRPLVTREFDHSFQLFDKHLYPGGAWRLHMLRRRMGDEVFWKAANGWITRYANSAVETAHFRLHCEERCKDPLARFFDQWIHGAGFPVLQGKYTHDLRNGVIALEMKQTQMSTEKDVGLFDMDLEVVLVMADGETRTVILDFDSTVRSDGLAIIQIPMDSAPVALYFDPDMCYLFQLNIDLPVSMLTKIAESAPDVRNRTWAFNALLSHGLGDSIATALTIAQAEEHWEVRVVFFKALAKRGARYAKEMVKFVLAESDIRAVWQMLAVCAVRHPAIRELLLSFIRNPETLPVARRWAIRSLGAQRATEDIALLKELFASDDSFHELTSRGVIEAMGKHHSPTAHQFLLPLIEYGKLSDRLRPACVRALAHTACALGEMQRKFTSEAIVPLINDRIYDVRMAAVDSLVILSATDHIGDVRAAHNLFAAQDLPWLEECIAELSDSDKNGTRVLEDRIAAMQSQINGMSVSILKLESMVAALAD